MKLSQFAVSQRVVGVLVACLLMGLLVLSSYAAFAQRAKTPNAATTLARPVPFVYPKIKGHGKVILLADAVDQPRAGTKICVDVTTDGPAGSVNPAIEKVARYVNIYAGAGEQLAEVNIAVVLHGPATRVALSDAAYQKATDAAANPNARLLRLLSKAGVELLVCGQSLTHKGFTRTDVVSDVEVAVSALTANVNRQMDGYAVLQLR